MYVIIREKLLWHDSLQKCWPFGSMAAHARSLALAEKEK